MPKLTKEQFLQQSNESKEALKQKELEEQAAQQGLVDKDQAVSVEADKTVDLDQAELKENLRDYMPVQ